MPAFRFHPGDVVVIDGQRWDPVEPTEAGILLRPQSGERPRPHSWIEFTDLWAQSRLWIERRPGADLPQKLIDDMRKDISVFTPAQQEVARYRMKFIRALEFVLSLRRAPRKSLFVPAREKPRCNIVLSDDSLDRLCKRVAKVVGNNGGSAPPSGAALQDWYRRYRKSGRCYCALVPGWHHRGNWGSRHHPIAIAAMNKYAKVWYLRPERPPISEIYKLACNEMRQAFRKSGIDKQLIEEGKLDKNAIEDLIPSDKSFYRLIQKIGKDVCIANRDDPSTADRELRIKKHGPKRYRPGEEVQIDTSELPVVLQDPDNDLKYKNVQLTFAVDVASHAITGYYVGLERGSATIQETLRMTMLPKTWVAREGIKNSWDCCVKPERVLTDQGADFRSESLVLASAQLGIRLMHAPAGRPDYKGIVERLFRRAKNEMFAGMPGSLFKNGKRRSEYDAAGNAILTMAQVQWIVLKFIVDIYMRDWHDGIDWAPGDKWKELTDRHDVSMPDRADQLTALISTRTRRTLQHTGIEWEGLEYDSTSPALQALRYDRSLEKFLYHVAIDAFDVGRAWLLDPTTGRWIPLRCKDDDAFGRTKHEHLTRVRERNARRRKHKRERRAELDEAVASIKGDAHEKYEREHGRREASRLARRISARSNPMDALAAETIPLEHKPTLQRVQGSGKGRPPSAVGRRARPMAPLKAARPVPITPKACPDRFPASPTPPPRSVEVSEIRAVRRRAPVLPATAIPPSPDDRRKAEEQVYVTFF